MSTQTATVNKTEKRVNVRYLTVTAMLSAVAYILMFLDFSVPFMPAFIKMDLSDLPALIGTFATGPVGGILIALIKNILHLTVTSTAGVMWCRCMFDQKRTALIHHNDRRRRRVIKLYFRRSLCASGRTHLQTQKEPQICTDRLSGRCGIHGNL